MSRIRPWRPRRQPPSARLLILLVLIALAGWRAWQIGQPPIPVPGQDAIVHVARAVDGDTLLLSDGHRVRLLGVDTPETKRENTPVQAWGPEAHEFTREHVEGKDVRLQFDLERRDKYDRLLAYVYFGDFFLNEELLRAGLGRALLQFPYSDTMKRRFRKAQQEARDAHRGIWSDVTPSPAPRRVSR